MCVCLKLLRVEESTNEQVELGGQAVGQNSYEGHADTAGDGGGLRDPERVRVVHVRVVRHVAQV